jgi:phage baseplate assembly protein gpV
MDFKPTINVSAPEVNVAAPVVKVEAPPAAVNNITVEQPPMSIALDKGEVTIAFSFTYSGPSITGGTATIKRK